MQCDYEREIEQFREQLIEVAREEGLDSENTMLLSRKLDQLINEYDERKRKTLLKK